MKVIYSTGARFVGGRANNISSYHAINSLYRHQMLQRLICGSYKSTEIPNSLIKSMGVFSRIYRKLAVYDKRNWLNDSYRIIYDHWAARQITRCNIFLGWGGYCLRSFQKAKELGATVVMDLGSGHPVFIDRLRQEENIHWGEPYHQGMVMPRMKKEIALADYIIIHSDFVQETFEAEENDTQNLIQVPFGVNTEHFCPAQETRSGDPFRVLFAGYVSILKGVPYLLEAWKLLNWSDAELWLAGRNKLSPELLNQYKNLKGVRFLGYVNNPVSVFQQSDVFVFPSLTEGSALVNYEAMACGLPVITTYNAGSIVQDGQEGFTIPMRDVDALANRLEKLRSDVGLRRQMGQAARKKAEKFSWTNYGNNFVKALHTILDN